jgi:hypothetical protein
MASKKQDLEMGKIAEDETIPILNEYFKTTFKKNDNAYGVIDFFNEDKTIYIELKARRLKHNQYETTMIGQNKIKYYKNLKGCSCYLCFKYIDGLYFIKYEKQLFKTFKTDTIKINFRQDVGKTEFSDVIYIPYKHLIKIKD